MADLTDFFSSGGSGGVSNIKTSPLELPLSVVRSLRANTNDYPYSASFWNNFAGCGGHHSDTYNTSRSTLVDITNGSGYLYNVISRSCQALGANANAYIYVTVDGIEYTVSGVLNKKDIGDIDRLVLGHVRAEGEFNGWSTSRYDSNQEVPIVRTGFLEQSGVLEMKQAPILRFETSLKVETKIDVYSNQSYAYTAGVNYRIDS